MCRVKHKGKGITEINKGVEGGKPRAGPNFGDALARVQKLFKMGKNSSYKMKCSSPQWMKFFAQMTDPPNTLAIFL